MLLEFSQNINADTILFEDHTVTQYYIPSAIFRLRKENDQLFEHKVEGAGEYVLEVDGEIVALVVSYYTITFHIPICIWK